MLLLFFLTLNETNYSRISMPHEAAAEIEIGLDSLSEEELARRVQGGCAVSFEELDRRFRPRLEHLLTHRLGNFGDAEEVAQLTLLRVFEKIAAYNPARRLSPWVFTIAFRLATDHLRREKKTAEHGTDQVKLLVDPGQGPDQQLAEREARHDLWSLAKRVLETEQWTALWLFYAEQHSVREVAQAMGRTSVSVRVLLYRARKALLPYLEDPNLEHNVEEGSNG